MVDFKNLVEAAKVHPMAVHAYSVGGGKFKVHATGSQVNKSYVKPGDHIRSSDLDDLSDSGFKVKEINKPKDMKEEAEPVEEMSAAYKKMLKYQKKKKAMGEETESFNSASLDENKSDIRDVIRSRLEEAIKTRKGSGYGHAADAHFSQQSPKMQNAINLHLRKGKSYDDAVAAAKKHVKEEAEQIDEISKKLVSSYGSKAISQKVHGVKDRTKGINLATAKMYPVQYVKSPLKAKVVATEEVEQVDEKLSDEAKKNIRTALGTKTPDNPLRKSSAAAKTMIKIAKSNPKNMKEGADDKMFGLDDIYHVHAKTRNLGVTHSYRAKSHDDALNKIKKRITSGKNYDPKDKYTYEITHSDSGEKKEYKD